MVTYNTGSIWNAVPNLEECKVVNLSCFTIEFMPIGLQCGGTGWGRILQDHTWIPHLGKDTVRCFHYYLAFLK